MFKKKLLQLASSKLFDDERVRLGALLYAIENGIWNNDIKRLARGIDRKNLLGFPWLIYDLVGSAGGPAVPAKHPIAKQSLTSMLNAAIQNMEYGEDLVTEEELEESDGPEWID